MSVPQTSVASTAMPYVRPFVVFALPRSRTAWLSRFLTYGGWTCGHEELRRMRGLADVRNWLALPQTGTVETAGAHWWRLLRHMAPETRVLVIRRPVEEVFDSLERALGPQDRLGLMAKLQRLDAKLTQVERRWPGAKSFDFASLDSPMACSELFEYALPFSFDYGHWLRLAQSNIQISLEWLVRYYLTNKTLLDSFEKAAKQYSLGLLARREVEPPAGVTFQLEPFDDVFRDAEPLIKQHCMDVGESPDSYMGKNLELLRMLEGLGCLQTLTARSNGRIFGYLVTLTGPSLEDPAKRTALHTSVFASPLIPGLGQKLLRESIRGLTAQGIDELYMRAGVRGSGARMGSLYKRLGAEDFGTLYKLPLGG